MALSEFDIIARYFSAETGRDDVIVGVGDDAAVLRPPADRELVMAVDTLVAGRHFTADADPADVGFKAVAVNLSDLAAMGAEPAWMTLALTLPEADPDWLAAFAGGLREAAAPVDLALVGGDTTAGPLTVTVQVCGFVPFGQALRRAGARPGDEIFVTGRLGEAGLALELIQGRLELPLAERERVMARLNRPKPRLAAGRALRGVASSAIDVSDGLAADLGHILEASGVGATLELNRLPLSPVFDTLGDERRWQLPLSAGDDYELVFTAADAAAVTEAAAVAGVTMSPIGRIETQPGLRCLDPTGARVDPPSTGYNHFPNG